MYVIPQAVLLDTRGIGEIFGVGSLVRFSYLVSSKTACDCALYYMNTLDIYIWSLGNIYFRLHRARGVKSGLNMLMRGYQTIK
jgi:hypothetical protein